MPAEQASDCWTCARCEVTARAMPGRARLPLPVAWSEESGKVFCLACRRELAAEAGSDAAPDDTPRDRKAQLRTRAVVEFELRRDPDRSNVTIARAARSSVPAVQKARRRIGPVAGTG